MAKRRSHMEVWVDIHYPMSRSPQILQRLLGAVALVVLGGGLAAPLLVAAAARVIIILAGLYISWRMRNPASDQGEDHGLPDLETPIEL